MIRDEKRPKEKGRTPRWRYVVPNAITCTGLLVGLTSVFCSMEGDYHEAAWLIVLCVLLDKADGTAARLLRATSAIGVQLDSFSDFVTFGVAPGTLVYMLMWRDPNAHFVIWQGTVASWLLRVLVASYVLGACIRLAKFNVLTEDGGPNNIFYGLPTTYCGAMVATLYVSAVEHGLHELLRWMPLLCLVLGMLMLSNMPLPKIGSKKSKVYNAVQVLGAVLVYVFGLYGLWGGVWGLVHREEFAPRSLDPYPP
jgi:CDP-diacylglycerol--serine O-phosphatidyltransferase